jgi:putative ABC transport system substrate-binding protein
MRRRAFISLIGGAAAWSLAARAALASEASGQRGDTKVQGERMRRIGVLMPLSEGDQEARTLVSAFVDGLRGQGWTVGRNVSIDYRWAAGDAQRIQAFAKELVEQNFDLILARSSPVLRTLMRQTRTIPIVFFQVVDPVGQGFVANLARPGGNVTGFTIFEPTIGSKWLELLKEIAPRVARVALIYNRTQLHLPGSFLAPSLLRPRRS